MASVARQPAATMMARVDRLDMVLAYLEEMHHQQHRNIIGNISSTSPSTPASTLSGDSSAASTPRGSWRRACRPAKEVLEEAQAKSSLVDRIAFLEDRVLRMEEDMEITPEKISVTTMSGGSGDQHISKEKVHHQRAGNNSKKKGLKSLVKSCVRGKLKTKD